MKKDKQFKIGDRVIDKDLGKGVVVFTWYTYGSIVDVEFDSGKHVYIHTDYLKRLVKKKKPPREPRRFWVNEYGDGKFFIHPSEHSAIDSAGGDNFIRTIEVVEVIK